MHIFIDIKMLELISSKKCPFAHRVEIVRILAKQQGEINISFVDPVFSNGWKFPENIDQSKTLEDLYKNMNQIEIKFFQYQF